MYLHARAHTHAHTHTHTYFTWERLKSPALVAQFLWLCAAVPKRAGSMLATVAAFVMRRKVETPVCRDLSAN